MKESVVLRKRRMKDGGFSLYLDYTVNGVRTREFLKLYLVEERTKIDIVQNQETLKTANAMKSKRIVEIQNGKSGFRKRKGDKVRLLDYMEERRQYYIKRGSLYYAQTVKNCSAYVESFRGKDIKLSQVTREYIIGFIDHLNDSILGEGTIYTYYNALIIVLNSAVRENLIEENPSKHIDARMKPSQKESTRAFLTLDELRLLMKAPSEDPILKAAFLFACFTGLRISDLRTLSWENIIDIGKGKTQIQTRQSKTGGMVFIPLTKNAKRWMPKKKKEGLVFPSLPESPTLDRRLDRWAKSAEIKKHVTFHVSRHTYATLLLNYGADLYTVSQLLGHKNIKTTQIYAKIMDESKRKAVDNIPVL